MNDDISIFVITHKVVDLKKENLDCIYHKLMVGKQKKDFLEEDLLFDSEGDNISSKNKNYCELTGLYWMWKNVKCNVIGLCHYRRFVLNDKLKIMSEKDIKEVLKKYDIILPKAERMKNKENVFSYYKKKHYGDDLLKCREIIEKIYPEYLKTFDKVIYGKKYYPFNMFIMSKSNCNQYCKWLFTIFNELEKLIDIDERDDYQKRVYGFLSERLFYVWILNNKLKIKENFILKTDINRKDKIKFYIKFFLYKIKNT